MELTFKELQKKDHQKVIAYAIQGMHFQLYVDNKILLQLYGRYFWYLELLHATQVLALYDGDTLAGVLVSDMYDEPKVHHSFSMSLFVKCIDFVQAHFFKDSVGIYDAINQKMLREYKKKHVPDGEIRFLAANPDLEIRGIGTILLKELERREQGKEIYLFTDDQCTYQFYEHRGFEKAGEEDIILELGNKIPLKCFLYRKRV